MDQTEADNVSRVQVSVKLTAFYSQFDPLDAQGGEEVSSRIRILFAPPKLGAAVHFDMEQYAYKDLTLYPEAVVDGR